MENLPAVEMMACLCGTKSWGGEGIAEGDGKWPRRCSASANFKSILRPSIEFKLTGLDWQLRKKFTDNNGTIFVSVNWKIIIHEIIISYSLQGNLQF